MSKGQKRFRQPQLSLENVTNEDIPEVVVGLIDLGVPAAAAADGVHAAITQADGAETEVITGITDPDVPRCVSIVGNQVSCAGDVVIEGKRNGEDVTDTIALNGTTSVLGVVAFDTISKITVPARAASGDTVTVGTSAKLGLPFTLSFFKILAGFADTTEESTAPTIVADDDELEKNVITFNTAPDASKQFRLMLALV